jgi:hypothetical protein
MDKEFKKRLNELTNKTISMAMSKDKIIRHQQILIDMLINEKDKAEIEKGHFIGCLRELQCFVGDKEIYQPINKMLNDYLNNT